MSDVVKVGERRTFRSTMQGEDGNGILTRLYTDQLVDVVAEQEWPESEPDDGEERDRLFTVRADDGVEFSAFEFELIEHGSNVYVLPSGEYVTDPEFKFNEEK